MISPVLAGQLRRLRAIPRFNSSKLGGETWLTDNDGGSYSTSDIIRNEELYHFDSLRTFVRFLEDEPVIRSGKYPVLDKNPNMRLTSDSAIKQTRNVFNCVDRFEEALKLARNGWPDGLKRVAAFEADILKNFMREVDSPSFFRNVSGGDVDVDAFLRGEPENMVDYLPTPVNARSPRIFIDVNIRCDACGRRAHDANPSPPDFTMIRGATVVLLTKILARYNLRPEIIAGTSAIYNDDTVRCYKPDVVELKDRNSWFYKNLSAKKRTTLVTLYRPGEMLNLNTLIFALGHDSFVRKLQFRFEEILNISELGAVPLRFDHESSSPHMVGLQPLGLSHLDVIKPNFSYDGKTYSDIYLEPYYAHRDREGTTGEDNDFRSVQGATQWLLDTLSKEGLTFV